MKYTLDNFTFGFFKADNLPIKGAMHFTYGKESSLYILLYYIKD